MQLAWKKDEKSVYEFDGKAMATRRNRQTR
jgi:hypothetical protein